MLALSDDVETLRKKIINDLHILDMDDLKKVYQTMAAIAAEKAIKFADRDWQDKEISREKIDKEIKNFRQSQVK